MSINVLCYEKTLSLKIEFAFTFIEIFIIKGTSKKVFLVPWTYV